MKPISTDNREFLGGYVDAQNSERFPEGLLCCGLLLSGTLLAIYCLAAGMLTLVTIVCVLILGSGLGILKHFGPYNIPSFIGGLSLTTSIKRPVTTPT